MGKAAGYRFQDKKRNCVNEFIFIFQSKVLANQKKSHSMLQNNGTLNESMEKETAECESTVEATKAKRKKHVSLALQDRVLVIDMHNQGMSTRKIAAELGCSKTQVQVSSAFA